MSILTVSNVAKSFGAETLFSGVTFSLAAGQKMGLVGRNGSGKTTLLRILVGLETADPSSVAGKTLPAKISLASGRRIEYLRQEAPVHTENTILEEAQSVFAPVREIEAKMKAAEVAMTDAHDDTALSEAMQNYARLREEFEVAGGYRHDADVSFVLQRLGFSEQDHAKRAGDCSGGEQTRLALAKIVLSRPDVLILDEPTNHLDIAATEWLEGFLTAYDGAVILVSHDRYFLDAVADSIAELEDMRLTLYNGNYAHYAAQKDEQRRRQEELYDQQQAEIARLQDIIKRNMGADSIQSSMRHKIQGRIDRMDKVDRPDEDASAVRAAIDAAGAGRVGREVVRAEGLSKRYGQRTLFAGLDLLIERGDRVGVVGPNGAGKTTLVKLILGVEQPSEGWLTLGHNVRLSYFSQHAADSLDVDRSVIDSLLDIADMTQTEARNYLARFLFVGDDVFKKVSMLSGGEKNKLALARMIVEPCNLLILDEPTNHLDIRSADALTNMLRRYESTLLLISHDRYLLNSTTTKTLAIAGDGRATLFDGPYSAWREAERATAIAPRAKPTVRAQVKPSHTAAPAVKPMNAHELSKARIKARDVLAKAEANVHSMETRLAQIETKLARPADGVSDMVALAAEHTRLQDDLTDALSQWERAASEVDALGA